MYMHTYNAQGGQKRASEPLRLEFPAVVSYHVLLSHHQARVLYRSNSALNPCSTSPALRPFPLYKPCVIT